MSDAAHDDHDLPHEGPIKTPKQLIWAVVLAFVVPVIAIVLLVQYVTSNKKPSAGNDEGMGAMAVAERLQRVGRVEIKDVSDPGSLKSGEQVYAAQCVACHGSGAAGAPKLGDEAAWAPRIKTGYEALLTSALKGKGSMGAQGGGDFSDLEIGRAVVYLANKAGGKLDEPKAPAAPAAKAEAAPAAAPAPAPAPAPATTATAAPAPAAAAAVAVAAAPAKADAVPALYTQSCSVCHATGVAGAPKLGDKAAWAPRLAAGVDGLTANAIKGKNAMPAKGGAANASDADIKAAVAYMVSTVK